MEWLTNPDIWIAFLTLLTLEIVLGIDNIVFISILAGKLPVEQQARARQIGLGLALVSRLILLASLSWIIGLTAPLFNILGRDVSGRDLILLLGGLFLIGKSTREIHNKLEGEEGGHGNAAVTSFASVLVQIMLLDVVFSLDSVITAVGLVDELPVMVAAVIVAIVIMLLAAGPVSAFVDKHPTVKMLALSFLLLIGTSLVAEGLHFHIPKGYIYGAMAFSVLVEALNLRAKRKSPPVHLRNQYTDPATKEGGDTVAPSSAAGH
jgi:predicted tellurium resistance membrane protein TerC